MRKKVEVDTHMHSHYSDGSDSPADVARASAAAGLKVACLTDHDSCAGTDEYIQTATELGVFSVPAVECSAIAFDAEVHILGYNVNHRSPEFIDGLKSITAMRDLRAQRMLNKVAKILGYPNPDIEEARALTESCGPYVGTWQVRQFFVIKYGVPMETVASLTKRTGAGFEPYDNSVLRSPVELVRFIRAHGGKAVFAHIGEFWRRLVKVLGEVDARVELISLIESLVGVGLTGLEDKCYKHNELEEAMAHQLAVKYGLYCFGGSDNHGKFTPEKKMGLPDKNPIMTKARFIQFLSDD